jgi:hypothetical protein
MRLKGMREEEQCGMVEEDRVGMILRRNEELNAEVVDAREECEGLRKAVAFARNFIETEAVKADGGVMKMVVTSYREEIMVLREQNARMQHALERSFQMYGAGPLDMMFPSGGGLGGGGGGFGGTMGGMGGMGGMNGMGGGGGGGGGTSERGITRRGGQTVEEVVSRGKVKKGGWFTMTVGD